MEMEITIARCGLACEVCKHFNRECLGCEKENRLKSRCLIFNCAKEKRIQYCIQCQEFPCKLMVGLSKAYCPVFTEIKLRQLHKTPPSIPIIVAVLT
jgi:hypothetical protein